MRRQVDWSSRLQRWDAQQEGYVPEREARFTAMLDVPAELLPASFTALDLACGPGSIGQRLLARFPEVRVIAVDIDPVMPAIGQPTAAPPDIDVHVAALAAAGFREIQTVWQTSRTASYSPSVRAGTPRRSRARACSTAATASA